jgi:hypothetical protein
VPPPEDQNDPEKPAGRVRHDSSGRAIWEWAAESGRHAIDSTSRLLKRLDMPGLMLADDAKKKQEEEEQAAAEALKAAGKPVVPTFGGAREADPKGNSKHSFNPYDTRVVTKRPAQKAPAKPAPKPAAPVKKPGFFGRLFGK